MIRPVDAYPGAVAGGDHVVRDGNVDRGIYCIHTIKTILPRHNDIR